MKTSELPEWAKTISELRQNLGMNQAAFARLLQASAMAVSRWERGVQEPTSRSYLEIGRLAGDPKCWYFWERAGLHREDLMEVLPTQRQRLQRNTTPSVEFVTAGSGGRKLDKKVQLATIPLLKAVAAAHGQKGDDLLALQDAPVESIIAAPREWCPNPASTSCLRVHGHSMEPAICDGDILAVDSSQSDISKLDGQIVIAWNKDTGLTVSRLRSYDHTEVLQPENSRYQSITLGHRNAKWKIVAKALWWIRRAS